MEWQGSWWEERGTAKDCSSIPTVLDTPGIGGITSRFVGEHNFIALSIDASALLRAQNVT
jgi:hypothetical protein